MTPVQELTRALRAQWHGSFCTAKVQAKSTLATIHDQAVPSKRTVG